MTHPNILIFNPDQMRADSLAHFGNPAAITPNLDKFLEDGVSFRNAFCQNPVCVPSRCSFLTGWYPHVRGHRTMSHMLQKDEPVLFKYLRDQGYYVWLNLRNDFLPAQNKNYYSEIADEVMGVKIHHRGRKNRPANPRFAKFFNKKMGEKKHKSDPSRGEPGDDTYYSFYRGKTVLKEGFNYNKMDEVSVDLAINFIKKRPKNKPFCVFLGLMAPHPPYGNEEPYFSLIDRKKLPKRIPYPENAKDFASMLKGLRDNQNMQSWSEERWDELRAVYLGMVAKIDAQFGQMVQTLKDEGIYDNTAIFFLSDHGDYTGDYGIVEKAQNTFQDCLTKVPLMIKPPKGYGVEPGIRNTLVELVDFYATVENYAGFTSKHDHFGKSLQPLIENSTEIHRDAVFCEGGRNKGETQCMEANSNPTLDPRVEYYPRQKMQQSEAGEHTKATMIRTEKYKYVRRFYEQDELYDLEGDPGEINNIIGDPGMLSVLTEMRNRMLEHYQETCDVVPKCTDARIGPFDIKIFAKMAIHQRKMKKKEKKLRKKYQDD